MNKKHLTILIFSLMAPSYLMANDSMLKSFSVVFGMSKEPIFKGGFPSNLMPNDPVLKGGSPRSSSSNLMPNDPSSIGDFIEGMEIIENNLNKAGSHGNWSNNKNNKNNKNKVKDEEGLAVIYELIKNTVGEAGAKNNNKGRLSGRTAGKNSSGKTTRGITNSPSFVIKRKEEFSEKLKNYLNTRLAEGTGFKVLRESKKLNVEKIFLRDEKYYKITFDDNVILKCDNKIKMINGVGFKCSSGRNINICFDAYRGKCHNRWYNINEVLQMKYDKLSAELTKTHLALFYKNDKGEDVEKIGSSVYGIYSVYFETVLADNYKSDGLRNFSTVPKPKDRSRNYSLKIHCIGKVCTFPIKIIRLVKINDKLRKNFLLAEGVDKKSLIEARTSLSGNIRNAKKISSDTSSCLKKNLERLLTGDNPLKCNNLKEVNVKRMVFSGKNANVFSSFSCGKRRVCVKYSSVPEEYTSCTQNIQWYPYHEEFKFVEEYDQNKTGVCVIPEQYEKIITYRQSPVLKVRSEQSCSVITEKTRFKTECEVCSENENGEEECEWVECYKTNTKSRKSNICNRWEVYSWSVEDNKKIISYHSGARPQYACASNSNLDDMTKQFIFYTMIGSKRLPIYSDWTKWAKNIVNNGNFFTILDNHLNYEKFIKGSNPETLAGMKEKNIEVVSHYCSILGGSKCSKEIIKEFMRDNDIVYPSKAAYELNKNYNGFVRTLSKLNCLLELHGNSTLDAKMALKKLKGSSTNFNEIFDLFQSDYIKDSFYNPMYNVNYPIEVRYDALLRVEDGNQ